MEKLPTLKLNLNVHRRTLLSVKLAVVALFLTPLSALAGSDKERFNCNGWTNAGLRMKGDVEMHLSANTLEWTNGTLIQTAQVVNPEDTFSGSEYSPMRIYLSEDRTATYFVRRLLDLVHVNRVKVTVNETRPIQQTASPLRLYQ